MTWMNGWLCQQCVSVKKNRQMSRIALGTVQFGLSYGINNKTGQVASSEVTAMLNLAKIIVI